MKTIPNPSKPPKPTPVIRANDHAKKRAQREASWLKRWQTRNWRTWLLWPMSLLYELITAARRAAYRVGVFEVYFAPVPVVVIGGILIGGVGKTPVVGVLVKALQRAGFTPAIVARGYGRDDKKTDAAVPLAVTRASLPSVVGDEPLLHLLNTNAVVWVGIDRAATVKALCAAHPEVDVIVCDDGLQHYRLARDIEIAVMDGRGLGNGWCLPAGPLREPPERLKEVDAIVLHQRCERLKDVQAELSAATVDADSHRFHFKSYISDAYNLFDSTNRLPLSYFSGKEVLSIAGIAQPEVFFNMLRGHNINSHTMPLPDHFKFDQTFIELLSAKHVQYVLMTEKDAVKYQHLIAPTDENRERLWVVPLEVLHTPELERLEKYLIERVLKLSQA